MTRELELERRAQRLVGRRIVRVWYHEVRTLVAVHLELDDGRRVRIGTSRELATRHAVGVCLGEQRTLDPSARDVTGTPPWDAGVIVAARIHWRAIEDVLRSSLRTGLAIGIDHLARHDFPHALELAWPSSALRLIAGTGGLDPLQLH